jgi:hypothetical protein
MSELIVNVTPQVPPTLPMRKLVSIDTGVVFSGTLKKIPGLGGQTRTGIFMATNTGCVTLKGDDGTGSCYRYGEGGHADCTTEVHNYKPVTKAELVIEE